MQKFITPLKIGILIVVAAYFLFTLHAMFTLSWIGEWEFFEEPLRTRIFVEDIVATSCLAFRFAASIIALAATITYFFRKNLSKRTGFKALRVIMIFEGIYWLGLSASAGFSVQGFLRLLSTNGSLSTLLNSLLLSVIPTVLEGIILPIILFIFAVKLDFNKPLRIPIKWGFITGTIMIAVFWLINTSIWVYVIQSEGVEYLWNVMVEVNGVQYVTFHPEHLVSFITSAFGLLALLIYAGYLTSKSTHLENIHDLRVRTIGIAFLGLGMFYLWNYFSWVFFAGDVWNNWYAWLLGHNMDLWMLALPLVALPMLVCNQDQNER